MGRKPNPIATEYFVRGRKLDDASNRYEQTCRFCNERFPKGRVDTLVAHILKRCAAVPFHDRQRAALHLDTAAHSGNPTAEAYDADTQIGGLPLQTHPGLSALETLAEVSRHHLDYQSQGFAAGGPVDQALDGDKAGPPAQKRRRIQSRAKEKVFPLHQSVEAPGIVSPQYNNVTDAEAQVLAAALYEAQATQEIDPTAEFLVQDDTGYGNAEVHIESGEDSNAVSTALQLAASAASELMVPQGTARVEAQVHVDDATQPSLSRFRANVQNPMIDPQLHTNDDDPVIRSAIAKVASLQAIASKTRPPDGFTEQRKQKARGKFSERRRKEVQNMRKLGACMRCRMLKKPCSDGTPCGQCMRIDSARLWKQPCIRTRLQDEVSLWSCGLFTVKAFKTTFRARELLYFESLPGRIEATAYPNVGPYMTFAGLRSTKPLTDAYGPAGMASRGINDSRDLHCIATETENILAKVERHIRESAPQYHHWETSPYMNATLEIATKFALQQPALLLLSVAELWLSTKILCRDLPLQVAVNAEELPSDQPSNVDAASPTTRAQDRHTNTYELVSAQILGAVEKHATTLARLILTELERRLIQRQQSNQAEIFIVSVILTACVERMCALFHSFDAQDEGSVKDLVDEPTKEQSGKQQHNLTDPALQHLEDQLRLAAGPSQTHSSATAAIMPQDWPLERPPAHYYTQGDRFADILHMLLQMRDITPRTSVNEAGIIVVSDGEQHGGASEWLEAVQLSDEQLAVAASEGGVMRYLGKLLDR